MSEVSNERNIKHKGLLLNQYPNTLTSGKKNVIKDFDEIVSLQKKSLSTMKPKTWSKLDKMSRISKLNDYVSRYSKEHSLDPQSSSQLKKYVRECLDRKRLTRVKDVVYDKDTGIISDIPGLIFNKQCNRFTFKSRDKKDSTLKNLTRLKNKSKSSGKQAKRKSMKNTRTKSPK